MSSWTHSVQESTSRSGMQLGSGTSSEQGRQQAGVLRSRQHQAPSLFIRTVFCWCKLRMATLKAWKRMSISRKTSASL